MSAAADASLGFLGRQPLDGQRWGAAPIRAAMRRDAVTVHDTATVLVGARLPGPPVVDIGQMYIVREPDDEREWQYLGNPEIAPPTSLA